MTRRRPSYLAFLLSASLSVPLSDFVLVGCGGGSSPPSEGVRVVSGVPEAAVMARTQDFEIDREIDQVGTSPSGRLITLVGQRVHELVGGEFLVRPLYARERDPSAMGSVHEIAPKEGGGVWIAASAGLFSLEQNYVTHIPFDIPAGTTVGTSAGTNAEMRGISEISRGPLSGLWMATDRGLFWRHTEGALEALRIPDLTDRDPTAIAAETEGTFALTVVGGELVLLEQDGFRILSDRPPLETGSIHAIASARGVAYAATDNGIFRYRPEDTPKWTRFTLAVDDDDDDGATSLAVDLATGAAWVRTRHALIQIRPDLEDRLFAFEAVEIGDTAPAVGLIAVDAFGDVWTASGTTLRREGTTSEAGGDATFEKDVRPWISAKCSTCHHQPTSDFEVYDVFTERAEYALSRVRAGDMPRCAGGVVCAKANRLLPEQYAVLEAWIRAGKPR